MLTAVHNNKTRIL